MATHRHHKALPVLVTSAALVLAAALPAQASVPTSLRGTAVHARVGTAHTTAAARRLAATGDRVALARVSRRVKPAPTATAVPTPTVVPTVDPTVVPTVVAREAVG